MLTSLSNRARATILPAVLLLTFGEGASAAPGPSLSYQEAQRLPQPEVVSRLLDQIGADVVDLRRPRPGQRDPIEMAVRPVSGRGYCESRIIRVAFAPTLEASTRFETFSVFHAQGDEDWPLNLTGAEHEARRADEAEQCSAQTDIIDHYFEAPGGRHADLAIRTIRRIATGALGDEVPFRCDGPCPGAERNRWAGLSAQHIYKVASEPCPDNPHGGPVFCFRVDVFDGPARTRPNSDIVDRDGWTFSVKVTDPMLNTDIVTFREFVIEDVEVGSFLISGPAAFLSQ